MDIRVWTIGDIEDGILYRGIKGVHNSLLGENGGIAWFGTTEGEPNVITLTLSHDMRVEPRHNDMELWLVKI